MRTMNKQIRELVSLRDDEVYEAAKQLAVPYDLAKYVHDNGRLPVVNFAAGGVATPADAALMMELGAEGVFVGSGIFKSGDPPSALPPSCRPPPTGRTPICSHVCPRTSARPWSASTKTRSKPSWPLAASDCAVISCAVRCALRAAVGMSVRCAARSPFRMIRDGSGKEIRWLLPLNTFRRKNRLTLPKVRLPRSMA